MITAKRVRVVLTSEELCILHKAADICDQLHDALCDKYDIDFEVLRDDLKRIAYERTFGIDEESE